MKPDAKPRMTRPCPTPLLQRDEYKKELDRKCSEGILQKLPPIEAENSEWGFPIFGVPKKDEKQARAAGDFRALNAML